ncbi:MAG: DUF1592 domain-containing protein [Planctomycetaceae bacterium]|nr:DUF1592 domain-containing protein [Planctomycetaceae bacterium]
MRTYRSSCGLQLALVLTMVLTAVSACSAVSQDVPSKTTISDITQPAPAEQLTLEELKQLGASRSEFLKQNRTPVGGVAPEPQLAVFRQELQPILNRACVQCHGADLQEGNIRIDTLNPDLQHGDDVSWWLEIFAVLGKGEMPPPDENDLTDDERSRLMDWLSTEIQVASAVRKAEQGHSSFRRMTRYEYNYALQDLLGLPYDFAKDLPPEAAAEGGFQNSSDLLHMSVVQFETYRDLARSALLKATVRGDQPSPLYWAVTMQDASADSWSKQEAKLDELRKTLQENPEELQQQLQQQMAAWQNRPGRAYYLDRATGRTSTADWSYPGAKYAWKPTSERPPVEPDELERVAVIPPGQKLIVELGDRIPDSGTLRVRVRASRTTNDDAVVPSLQLEFGWQASNDSHASVRISQQDLPVTAAPEAAEFYQWDVPVSEIYPRNLVRHTSQLGDLPSPSEYIRFVNSTVSGGDVQLDYVEVIAPVYEQWPPASHVRILGDAIGGQANQAIDESKSAQQILMQFMPRAWRRPVTDDELQRKLKLFLQIRPECDDFQEAMTEVLAVVLSSPQFLYLVQQSPETADQPLRQDELATRLSMFLWCSIPDEELRELANSGRLLEPAVLSDQVTRMLADDRASRLSQHFVQQWLDMQLLEFRSVPRGLESLKQAMQQEPVALFDELLRTDACVLDFLHADYTMANERLAQHYGLPNVRGNDFRRVSLPADSKRGGLLTQAGLLTMNSAGDDSHPIKRGVWLLEKLLNDPPPPPPPAVPEIDLADPEIAKMTLKERIEDHRNHAACMSCHAKIDPWGITFENYDALGRWRDQIADKPIDATSTLFNDQKLDGMDGLKRFLLENRQDQFVRAMVHKLTTYALGRPLTFADRSAVDEITLKARQHGDGLATMIKLIAMSDLFRS